ncbi:RidA family protein [Enterobacter hormaechei]|uniref:RidA family protein n=1 Tax=Enterobacter hormaechei TaxID=158836 RepID=UPI00294A9929|nr:RidA family protein [Enterobacter hormaechei]MDV5373162.1 RidA family protein [Enterobacter hormaechei]
MSKVVKINTSEVPEPASANWSNALQVGNEIILSGMTAHPFTERAAQELRPLNVYEQTIIVLNKCKALVEAAGGNIGNIYRLRIYVINIADKDEVGRARLDFFSGQSVFPTSTLVAIKQLVFPELSVEIEASARLDINLSTI